MSDAMGSVTQRIHDLREGRNVELAARVIWDRYFMPLARLARKQMQGVAGSGEEDVALSSIDSLCRGLSDGRFPDLSSRDELFRLLATITARKAANRLRDERRLRRGGGRLYSEGALQTDPDGPAGFDGVAGDDPSPDFDVLFAEEVRGLFDRLDDDDLRAVLALKLEDLTNQEIADRLEMGLRTVERKIAVIRSACQQVVLG